jgi:hypothetical protein
MQKENRALTVAARRRQRETGETYMQALAAVSTPRLNRDPAADTPAARNLGFAQLMEAGATADAFPSVDPAGAGAAVRAAVTALWPRLTPAAVADVLVACAAAIVSQGGDADPDFLDGWGDCGVARGMLNITWLQVPNLTPPPRLTPQPHASSLAADPAKDAAVLAGTCVLLALARQRDPGTE